MQNTATITICVWKLKLLRMETVLFIYIIIIYHVTPFLN